MILTNRVVNALSPTDRQYFRNLRVRMHYKTKYECNNIDVPLCTDLTIQETPSEHFVPYIFLTISWQRGLEK